jgi:hypothetical protein
VGRDGQQQVVLADRADELEADRLSSLGLSSLDYGDSAFNYLLLLPAFDELNAPSP